IGYAVFETTRLPGHLRRAIASLDQVWVPAHWCRDRLVAQGIPAERIRVIPEGVDVEKYGRAPVEREPGAVFRFLSVGKWEKRKCQEELIRTFIDTFDESEPVELILHAHNPFLPGVSLERKIREASVGTRHRIRASAALSDAELVALYRGCDAFVLPSRGEAWGLPIVEAMAAGLPVITTAHAGPLDFIAPEHAFPL